VWTIVRKELADHFSSTRFLILFCLIIMAALITSYMVGAQIREALEGARAGREAFLLIFTSSYHFLSVVNFIAFFGPLLGIIMGFDAINKEKNAGTLSKLLAQPIWRDAVINGKFIAGVITIALVLASLLLLVSGLGLLTVGVVPGGSEVLRLLIYYLISVLYVSFWMGLAMLFSVVFRLVATSALASVALWIFFAFFIGIVSTVVANAVRPVKNPADPNQHLANAETREVVQLISPAVLFSKATEAIVDPYRRAASENIAYGRVAVRGGRMEYLSMERFKNPLPVSQSLAIVLPYILLLVGITAICFTLSYIIFMKQEIRAA